MNLVLTKKEKQSLTQEEVAFLAGIVLTYKRVLKGINCGRWLFHFKFMATACLCVCTRCGDPRGKRDVGQSPVHFHQHL